MTSVVIAHRFGYTIAKRTHPTVAGTDPRTTPATTHCARTHHTARKVTTQPTAGTTSPDEPRYSARSPTSARHEAELARYATRPRAGDDISAVELNGAHQAHRAQPPLSDEPTRVYTQPTSLIVKPDTADRSTDGNHRTARQGQPTLFDLSES